MIDLKLGLKIRVQWAVPILLVGLFLSVAVAANDEGRELVHLLDYLSQDYGGAVKDGKIISKSEYQEQMEFSETAGQLSYKIPKLQTHMEVRTQLDLLHQLVVKRAKPEEIVELSQKIKKQVINITGLIMAPDHWPSLTHGQKLYSKFCVNCHGADGDGHTPAAQVLNPPPISFLDETKMDVLSPFKVFNAIRIGVPNTAMMAQGNLSDEETWEISFYVMSVRHQQLIQDNTGAKEAYARLSQNFDLVKISTLTDGEIRSQLKGEEAYRNLAILRTHSGDEGSHDSLELAQAYVSQALSFYKEGKFEDAKSKSLLAYLEGVEPVEPRLRATDPELTSNLENHMALLRSAIVERKSFENILDAATLAKKDLDSASLILNQGAPSPWITFFIAAAILLREGFEAVLIIIALLGVIRAGGSVEARKWVHGGWIAALFCGALAWFLSGLLMAIGGARRELMEAFTSIFAVIVLLYMGFWLHRTTEIGRWTHFIHVKVRTALERKKLFGLFIISFTAVFREAFETVLFLRALWIEGGMETKWAMLGGVLGSLAFILVLAWAILKYTAKIPIRRLFDFSSTLMTLLAVILIGKGFHSLQEVGILGVTPSPINIRAELIGFFPTFETIVAQVAILAVALALWFFGKKPSKKASSDF